MGRVVHFEIHSADPEGAAEFYRELFGWTISKWDGPMDYWNVGTGEDDSIGIDGGLMVRQGPPPEEGQPVNSFVCTIDVDDLDATLAKAKDLGANQAVDKMPVPGVGWLAYIKDLDGNILGLMQSDDSVS